MCDCKFGCATLLTHIRCTEPGCPWNNFVVCRKLTKPDPRLKSSQRKKTRLSQHLRPFLIKTLSFWTSFSADTSDQSVCAGLFLSVRHLERNMQSLCLLFRTKRHAQDNKVGRDRLILTSALQCAAVSQLMGSFSLEEHVLMTVEHATIH